MRKRTTLLLATVALLAPLVSGCSNDPSTRPEEPARPSGQAQEMGTTPIPTFLHDKWIKQWYAAEVFDASMLDVGDARGTVTLVDGERVYVLNGYSLYPCAGTVRKAEANLTDYQETLFSDPKQGIEVHAAVMVFPTDADAARFQENFRRGLTEVRNECTSIEALNDGKGMAVSRATSAVLEGPPAARVTSIEQDTTYTQNVKTAGDGPTVAYAAYRAIRDQNVVTLIDAWRPRTATTRPKSMSSSTLLRSSLVSWLPMRSSSRTTERPPRCVPAAGPAAARSGLHNGKWAEKYVTERASLTVASMPRRPRPRFAVDPLCGRSGAPGEPDRPHHGTPGERSRGLHSIGRSNRFRRR